MNIHLSTSSHKKDARFRVEWETDGDRNALASLPKEVNVPNEIAQEGIDNVMNYLSDQYGWLILNITRLIA